MRKQHYILCLLLTSLYSCSSFLDIVPDDVATIEHAFRDKVRAEKFLATCYSYIPQIGNPARDPAIMGSDETWNFINTTEASSTVGNYGAFYIKMGLQNTNDPYVNYWDNRNYGGNLFEGISNCNIFIKNIDKVGPQLSGVERERWRAEAKFLKAYFHYYLLKMYGPIHLIKENISIEAPAEEMRIYREPFDDCINYIIELIDQAKPYLPLRIENVALEMGRITQPIALAIKAEVLITAASPLFNGNEDFKSFADKRGVKLFTQKADSKKWETAAIACKNAIDTCLMAGHDFYEFDDPNYVYNLSEQTKLINSLRCVVTYSYNKEVIWGGMNGSINNYQTHSLPFFVLANAANVPWKGLLAPTIRMAELYYSNNGVPIEEDEDYDYPNRYETEAAPESHKYYIKPGFVTAKLNQNREPRFYANLAFDGGYWYGNGRYADVDGPEATAAWVMRMKRGEASGKNGPYRYSITGYWAKKPSHIKTDVNSTGKGSYYGYSFPIIRLSDLYLYYAEALNEMHETPSLATYEYLDYVRSHAGLDGVVDSWRAHSIYPEKPSTQSGLREIIQRERMIELSFESKRFWDLRRWKLAHRVIPGPIKAWNVNGDNDDEYYQMVTIDKLNFRTRDYLWPIRNYAIRVNGNLTQNPNW